MVGAGFSGLAAALTLADAGVDVQVFEARDRVGGRVWSQELVPGDPSTVVERGAEFVLDGYTCLAGWVDRLGLTLADTTMSYYAREPRGGEPTDGAAMATVAASLAEAVRTDPSARSVAAVAAVAAVSGSTDPAAARAFLARVAISCAYPVDRLSANALLEAASAFAPLSTHRVSGGNQGIALAMAERLGARVRLGSPVRSVVCGEHSVTLSLDSGQAAFDSVILAVPLTILRELPLSPPAPEWKSSAWSRVGVGHAAKLHVLLAEPATASAVLSVPDLYWTWVATDASGECQPVAHCFSGSAPALDALGVAAGSDRWLSLLAQLRPELTLDGRTHLLTTWADDQWSRMAYSADSLGRSHDDDELLARPLGRVHFAGEHTAGEWASLMEGALRSGERAARELLALDDR